MTWITTYITWGTPFLFHLHIANHLTLKFWMRPSFAFNKFLLDRADEMNDSSWEFFKDQREQQFQYCCGKYVTQSKSLSVSLTHSLHNMIEIHSSIENVEIWPKYQLWEHMYHYVHKTCMYNTFPEKPSCKLKLVQQWKNAI